MLSVDEALLMRRDSVGTNTFLDAAWSTRQAAINFVLQLVYIALMRVSALRSAGFIFKRP
jgi:hypothetical protein